MDRLADAAQPGSWSAPRLPWPSCWKLLAEGCPASSRKGRTKPPSPAPRWSISALRPSDARTARSPLPHGFHATCSSGGSTLPRPTGDPELARPDRVVIVLCNEGYQSSLAAATLRRFGLDAADVIGGFQAWRAAGLPVEG